MDSTIFQQLASMLGGYATPKRKAKRQAREANTAIQQEIIAAAAAKRARRALRPVVDMTVRK